MKVKTIIWLIILILLVIFGIGNRTTMELWFFGTFYPPKIVVILVSFIIGFLAGIFLRNIRREERVRFKKETVEIKEEQEKKPRKKTGGKKKEGKKEKK